MRYFLLIFLFYGCRSNRAIQLDDIVGVYHCEDGSYFELSADSTFIYGWDVGQNVMKGTWLKKWNSLSLEQPPQPKYMRNDSVKMKSLDLGFIKVNVFDTVGEPIPFVSVVFKKADKMVLYGTVDYEGEIIFPKVSVDSLFVDYMGFKSIRKAIGNEDEIAVYLKESKEVFGFHSFKLKIKAGDLYDPVYKKIYCKSR